ncbi:PAS domain S-box protein [Haladaptatus sp. GCM10025707]|uniref:sensor histidine kinase n=1 Tax=unclassified Haladaptatus TaxID=2622732 RepID=UPI0023E8BB8A|nr:MULTISPECIES: PAS domain S-box protein [unclassified Haladaptatus]
MGDTITSATQFQALIEGSSDIITILDTDGTIVYQSPSVTRILGYEPGDILEDNAFDYVHPADRDEMLQEFFRAMENPGYIPTIEHRFRHADGSYMTLESRGRNWFDDPHIEGFIVNTRDVSTRVEREETLSALREASNQLVTTHSSHDVAAAMVAVAEDVLGESLSAVWMKADDRDVMRLTAQTDSLAELSLYDEIRPNRGLVWPVYRAGRTYVFDDIHSQDLVIPETPIHSAIMVPLGDHGVFGIGARECDAFTNNDADFVEILAGSATAALDRLEHEEELELQNRRLDFLNHILRHDVLNSMFVIQSRAEMLDEHTDDAGERYLETIDAWCDDIVSMTKQMRLIVETMSNSAGKAVEPVTLSEILSASTAKLGDAHERLTLTTSIPGGVVVRANDVLSQVFDNLLGNAVTHNSSAAPAIDVSCVVYADEVVVAIADNGGGVPDDRKESIFQRDVKGLESEGSGLGLYFVDTVVRSFGGDVWIEDNDIGGATFFVSLVPIDPTA